MTGFYELTTKIKDALIADPFINQVTKGDIDRLVTAKQNMYPLAHILVNNVTFENNVQRANISIIAMDLVDISKEETTDIFLGNDNEDDVLHTMLAALNRLYESLRRGAMHDDNYTIDGTANNEPFYDRFEDIVAGWTMTFDILIANDMTIC